jgi:hypothetical protein
VAALILAAALGRVREFRAAVQPVEQELRECGAIVVPLRAVRVNQPDVVRDRLVRREREALERPADRAGKRDDPSPRSPSLTASVCLAIDLAVVGRRERPVALQERVRVSARSSSGARTLLFI